MSEWSNIVSVGKRVEFNRPCLQAVLWAPFSMPFVGLIYSLIEPMPGRPIKNFLEVFEYLGLFALGALTLGFPLALAFGYPVLRFTSKYWSGKTSRLLVTLVLSLVPSLVIFLWLQELNYFTKVCLAMSVTIATCAQLMLFRLETLERA